LSRKKSNENLYTRKQESGVRSHGIGSTMARIQEIIRIIDPMAKIPNIGICKMEGVIQ